MNKRTESIRKLIDDIEQACAGQEEPQPDEARVAELRSAMKAARMEETFCDGIAINVGRGQFDVARAVLQKYRPSRAGMGLLLLGLAILVSGVYGGLHGLGELAAASASQSWPTATGKVESSSVGKYQQTSSNRESRSTSTYYKPEIEYAYHVDGKAFSGNRVSFGLDNMSRPEAEAKAAQYTVGSDVTVYYDPASPQESALEPGVGAGSFFLPIFCAIFGIVGLGIIIAAIRTRKT